MARATWVQNNFNGGEWSPLTYGRFDLAKYKNALSKCLNFVPLAQGGLTRRPGTRYASYAKQFGAPVRLQKFEFSTTQAYTLEFGAGYVRFYANEGQLQVSSVPAWNNVSLWVAGSIVSNLGINYWAIGQNIGAGAPAGNTSVWYPLTGTIMEVQTPYLQAELFQLNFVQSADTLYIFHPNHPPAMLQRGGQTLWTYTTLAGVGWSNSAPAILDGPYLPLNITTNTCTPTANSGSITLNFANTNGINNGYLGATGGYGFVSAIDVGRLIRWQQSGAWYWGWITAVNSTTSVAVNVMTPASGQTPRQATATATTSGGSVFNINITDAGGGYGATTPTVTLTGGGYSTAAIAYAQVTAGYVSGIPISVTGAGYSSPPTVTISAPAVPAGTATTFWRLGAWNPNNGYPATGVFNQDRLIMGGMPSYPNRIDGSQTGNYLNFAPTNVDGTVSDNCAISFNLNANQVNAVRWMISDEWGLLVGTAGAEWVVSPSTQQTAMTPTNISAKQSTTHGCSTVPAIRIGKSTLFIQKAGRKIREMAYQYLYNTFQAPDISLIGEHLTKGGIAQMVFALAPAQIVWLARTDGNLIGLSYDKDQDVNGWHQHTLGGYSDAAQTLPPIVESIAVIPSPDGTRDELWMSVQRYINGATVRTIEYATKFWEDGDTLSNAVFLDCSAVYNGAPTTTVTGLTWLVGQTVSVLTDGSVHPTCVVSPTGSITLQYAASVVQVGLGYTSQATTMRIEAGGQEGPSQGKYKRIRTAIFRFFQSVGATLAPNVFGVPSIPEPFRDDSMNMDQAIPLFTGDKRWSYEGTWDSDGQLNWTQPDPLPMNILMVSALMETDEGG